MHLNKHNQTIKPESFIWYQFGQILTVCMFSDVVLIHPAQKHSSILVEAEKGDHHGKHASQHSLGQSCN